MDRFRGRLVVPIFDSTGNNVLAFGGRQLDLPSGEQNNFSTPKYLNSPESVVFQKKNVLFGRHMAQKAIRAAHMKGDFSRAVVVVEGYMDAIALWQAGVCETVACMGTALTSDQLVASARLLGNAPNGKIVFCTGWNKGTSLCVHLCTVSFSCTGRVILCLDNDKAGAGAIERLCSGSILSSVTEQCPVEFRVALLPDGIKDPAEFFENSTDKENASERFREDVIETSIEWTQWYVNHIVSGYDGSSPRGAGGSFGAIFDRLAAFLAEFPNAAERTKRAVELGSTLAKILADETNTAKPSKTVRIQLESDLVEKASAIANERSAISSRINLLAVGSETDMKQTLANIAKGDGISGSDEGKMMRREKTPQIGSMVSVRNDAKPDVGGAGPEEIFTANWKGHERTKQATRKFRPRRKEDREKQAPPLTPHFSGFDDFSDSDARWLGLVDAKVSSSAPTEQFFAIESANFVRIP
jgi:DNA primase